MTNRFLLVCALRSEIAELLDGVLYTGIGKINAALTLERYLQHQKYQDALLPHLVVNYGSAGSKRYNTGELVQCARYLQRDMDVTALGFDLFATPFETDPPVVLEPHNDCIPLDTNVLCGSGDSFVANDAHPECGVLDMEAYALAKVCHHHKIPFIAFKYITDGADDGARADWETNVSRGATLFKERIIEAHLSSACGWEQVLTE